MDPRILEVAVVARGVLELRQPDPDRTTIHVPQSEPDGLTAYERMVSDRVRAVAIAGAAPLPALAFADDKATRAWQEQLRRHVLADARSARPTWRRTWWT
jgi:hypothetical protein